MHYLWSVKVFQPPCLSTLMAGPGRGQGALWAYAFPLITPGGLTRTLSLKYILKIIFLIFPTLRNFYLEIKEGGPFGDAVLIDSCMSDPRKATHSPHHCPG